MAPIQDNVSFRFQCHKQTHHDPPNSFRIPIAFARLTSGWNERDFVCGRFRNHRLTSFVVCINRNDWKCGYKLKLLQISCVQLLQVHIVHSLGSRQSSIESIDCTPASSLTSIPTDHCSSAPSAGAFTTLSPVENSAHDSSHAHRFLFKLYIQDAIKGHYAIFERLCVSAWAQMLRKVFIFQFLCQQLRALFVVLRIKKNKARQSIINACRA